MHDVCRTTMRDLSITGSAPDGPGLCQGRTHDREDFSAFRSFSAFFLVAGRPFSV
jgi:hypothetical protein